MKSKGRIALVIPHIASSLDNDLIGGIFSYCSQYGYDVIVLTSLHYKSQIFGYMCTSYKSSEDILPDEYYVSWCSAHYASFFR